MPILDYIGAFVTLAGSLFLFVGALGILRMPDIYNRMQSGTKATTLGSFLFLLGIGIAEPNFIGKVVLLILFIVFTNPISSHALARAAHFINIPLAEITCRDCLANDESEGGEECP